MASVELPVEAWVAEREGAASSFSDIVEFGRGGGGDGGEGVEKGRS